jgi:hypothetical protein
MTTREAYEVTSYEARVKGVVTDECLQHTDLEVKLYNDVDLIKVTDNWEDALDWLNEEYSE